MAMWNRCTICGRAIPIGELCYGVKNWRGDPTGGDTICRDCLVPENAPTLTPPNGWVSVEERLPEPTYCVLVYTTDYSIEVDARGSDGEWMSYEVTHWMPLPVPPDRRLPEGEAK